MRRKTHKILIILMLMCSIITTVFIPNTVASHVTIGTIDFLETKIFQVQGNLTLIFNNSDTGHQDITVTNLGYVLLTNKTVIQAKSNNITYDWTFVNNTKAYNYFDIFSNNTYTIYVNYHAINVPKSPAQLLKEMLDAKNITLSRLTMNYTRQLNITANLTKNMTLLKKQMVNLSAEMNQTTANNTPLHLQIINLTADNGRLDTMVTTKNNALIFANTTIGKKDDTIKELRDTWCMGYTYNDVGYIYVNASSMLIFFVILMTVVGLFLFRKKIWKKGKETAKNILTTSAESKKDITGYQHDQVVEEETDFLKTEKRAEVKDDILKFKENDPEGYRKMLKQIDQMETPPKSKTNQPPAKKQETQQRRSIDFQDQQDQGS